MVLICLTTPLNGQFFFPQKYVMFKCIFRSFPVFHNGKYKSTNIPFTFFLKPSPTDLSMLRTTSMLEERMNPPVLTMARILHSTLSAYHWQIQIFLTVLTIFICFRGKFFFVTKFFNAAHCVQFFFISIISYSSLSECMDAMTVRSDDLSFLT